MLVTEGNNVRNSKLQISIKMMMQGTGGKVDAHLPLMLYREL